MVQRGLTGSDGNDTFGKILRRFKAGLCLEDGLAGSGNRCIKLFALRCKADAFLGTDKQGTAKLSL